MSIETWKAEFYPVEADKVPEELAVEHSLRKWRGMTAENLAKHCVDVDTGFVYEPGRFKGAFEIDSESCALCQVHLREKSDKLCGRCPLLQHLGKRCDEDDDGRSPFRVFMYNDDPLPMIAALEAVAAKTPAVKR